jgi:FrmR/RcnR family transcriptional regulator, repressor of frmRAB operon
MVSPTNGRESAVGGRIDLRMDNIYLPGYDLNETMAHIIRDKEKLLNRVRRIRGQVEAVERALETEADCSEILHTIAACRGAINALMTEVIDGHIRFHVVDPDRRPTSSQAIAAQELIDIIKQYVR